MERLVPEARTLGGLTLPAIPTAVSGLKSGGVSVTFHISYEHADEAFSVHKMQGKSVTLAIALEEQ